MCAQHAAACIEGILLIQLRIKTNRCSTASTELGLLHRGLYVQNIGIRPRCGPLSFGQGLCMRWSHATELCRGSPSLYFTTWRTGPIRKRAAGLMRCRTSSTVRSPRSCPLGILHQLHGLFLSEGKAQVRLPFTRWRIPALILI